MSDKFKHIKKTGFTTPKEYFNSIEDSVFDALKTDDLLKDVNDPGFALPNDYFDNIEDTVLAKLESNDVNKVISLWSRRNVLYLSGIAAAIVLLFSVFINQSSSIEDLDLDLVENYILEEDISSYELASLLTEDELSSINLEIMDEAFTDEEMTDYLLENIDIEDIIEQ